MPEQAQWQRNVQKYGNWFFVGVGLTLAAHDVGMYWEALRVCISG